LEFTFAHLSDVHLGPLPHGAAWSDFALKRVIGGLSWGLRRRKIHDPAIAAALVVDIKAHQPDHIAFTGDLVNIAAIAEYEAGARWLDALGKPEHVSFTPGNHDAYVAVPYNMGLKHFEAYMTGDLRRSTNVQFPFVRLRRNVAFIGLSSASPQSLTRAGGTVGHDQLRLLAENLKELKKRGFYRAVLLHHPPLPGLAIARKALTDAAALSDVLRMEGAEVVLHGHNHSQTFNKLATQSGPVPVHGVPSASSTGYHSQALAEWHRYSVDRSKGTWRTVVDVRRFNPVQNAFGTVRQFALHEDDNTV
jgi:3',5'-cyclic AMP phosphodiesterase CpdA